MQGEQVTALDWVTLGVAVAALLLAAASMLWQWATRTASAGRVQVITSGGAASLGLDAEDATPVVVVEAVNIGRGAAEVAGWGLLVGRRRLFVLTQEVPGNLRVPYTLEGGGRVRWLVPLTALAEDPVVSTARRVRVRGFVHLRTGRRVTSRHAHQVDASTVGGRQAANGVRPETTPQGS